VGESRDAHHFCETKSIDGVEDVVWLAVSQHIGASVWMILLQKMEYQMLLNICPKQQKGTHHLQKICCCLCQVHGVVDIQSCGADVVLVDWMCHGSGEWVTCILGDSAESGCGCRKKGGWKRAVLMVFLFGKLLFSSCNFWVDASMTFEPL